MYVSELNYYVTLFIFYLNTYNSTLSWNWSVEKDVFILAVRI